MNTLIRKTVLTLSASLALVTLVAVSAAVAQSRLVLVNPDSGPDYCPPQLPQFGFASFSVHGVGERVTFVRWGGLASQLGLEPGDMILSMNGFPLNYHGSWTDALSEAVANGGWVQLRVRDVRTGFIAYRQTFVGGGEGPITHNYYSGGNIYTGGSVGPIESHVTPHNRHLGYPSGPITAKSTVGGNHGNSANKKIRQIAELFE